MNQKLLFVLSIIIVTFGYVAYESYMLEKKFTSFNTGGNNTILKTIPKIKFQKFESKEYVDLEQLAVSGNNTIVHFWATWCAPCEKEFPELVELTRIMKHKKDVKFLFIAVNDKVIEVKKFLKPFEKFTNFEILIDDSNTHQNSFGTFRLPETFLFGKDQKLIKKYIGQQAWTQKHFVDLLNGL